MRTAIRFVTTLVLILIAGVPALAKGPSSATITGPGIDEPVELIDYGDSGQRDLVAALMRQTGVWYGNMGLEETTDLPPDVELGPAYLLTWLNEANPGDPKDDYTIQQTLYPHAQDGPVVHTPAQPALDDTSLTIGWRTVPVEFNDTLRQLGVPIDSADKTASNQQMWAAVAVVAVVVAGAIRLMNSRLRPVVSKT